MNSIQFFLRRWIFHLAGTRHGMRMFYFFVQWIDIPISKLTKGAYMPSASGVMPIIYLTTTGAKSGEPRSLPVLSVPDGENLILVGSNWGNPKNPNWIYNLRAHPKAQVRRGNKQQKFRVRELTGDERGIYWQKATTLYPPYTTYQAHAGRTLPMFLLEPES